MNTVVLSVLGTATICLIFGPAYAQNDNAELYTQTAHNHDIQYAAVVLAMGDDDELSALIVAYFVGDAAENMGPQDSTVNREDQLFRAQLATTMHAIDISAYVRFGGQRAEYASRLEDCILSRFD